MTVRKYFKTRKEAEKYYLRLCDCNHSVKLVDFPRFSEDGYYVWEVSNDK